MEFGFAQAAAVAKVGSALYKDLKQEADSRWPNFYESLLELWALLNDYTVTARETMSVIQGEQLSRAIRNGKAKKSSLATPAERTLAIEEMIDARETWRFGAVSCAGTRYWNDSRRAFRLALEPEVKALTRVLFRPRQRRAIARRGLKTLMSLYCPSLLADFEDAVRRRGDFTCSHAGFNLNFHQYTDHEIDAMASEYREIQEDLVDVRRRLAELIVEKFPMWQESEQYVERI